MGSGFAAENACWQLVGSCFEEEQGGAARCVCVRLRCVCVCACAVARCVCGLRCGSLRMLWRRTRSW